MAQIPVPPVSLAPPVGVDKKVGWKYLIGHHSAAQAGNAPAQAEMGQIYLGTRGVPADPKLAVAWSKAAADQGYANAQLWLGVMYRFGDEVPADHALAATWFRKAADQGDESAQHFLGEMYAKGLGVPKDPVQAFVWLDLAVTAEGDGWNRASYAKSRDEAAVKLTPAQRTKAGGLVKAWKPLPLTDDQKVTVGGEALSSGRYDEALKALRPLAEAGHRQAQFLVGDMYLQGQGVKRSVLDASEWYLKAANQGHPIAQGILALMYFSDLGVLPDKATAVDWLAKSARQNISFAQARYGQMLRDGDGVAADPAAAADMLRRAAEQGEGKAQYGYALMLNAGQGVVVDKVEAYKWLLLADTYEPTLVQLTRGARQNTSKGMSLGEVSEAERRAAAWTPLLPGP